MMIPRLFFLSFLLLFAGVAAFFTTPVFAGEAGGLRSVIQAIDANQWPQAQALAQRTGGIAKTLYEWQALQREDETYPFARYQGFLARFSEWPQTRKIRARAEFAMPDDLPAAAVLDFYRTGDPVSARGMLTLLAALSAQGRRGEAVAKLNDWFDSVSLPGTDQAMILMAYRKALSAATLARRVDALLARGEILGAQQLGRAAGGGLSELVAARIAVRHDQGGISGFLSRVSAVFRNDPGLLYDRIKWRRSREQNDGMLALLRALSSAGVVAYDETALWAEHQILIRRLLDDRAVQKAYQAASLKIYRNPAVQAQADWLAGYVALRFLKRPGPAFLHFEAAYKTGISPLTRSRSAFWAGLASEALNYPDVARAWFISASSYPATYYGQMAILRLPGRAAGPRHGPPSVSAADQVAFSHSGLAAAAQALCAARDEKRCTAFLRRMADHYEGRGAMVRQVVDLARTLGQVPLALQISREAGSDGIDFSDSLYPSVDWVTGGGGVEAALVHAVIRQESAFDPQVASPAGARGLMQLMPGTAAEVARKAEIAHRVDWLTDRPRHNVVLGSLYLKKLLEKYTGSYALAAAAYNAGPSRVDQWLERYGDPRTGRISTLDFIERIPVSETRNYTQRVLEGVTVYRRLLRTARVSDFSHLAP